MRVVVDTNIFVSSYARFKKGGSSSLLGVLVSHIGAPTLLADERILAEYSDVFRRPRIKRLMRLETHEIDSLLEFLRERSTRVTCSTRLDVELPDEKDRPFIESAIFGLADAIVTENFKDFPPLCWPRVVSPRDFLGDFEARRVMLGSIPFRVPIQRGHVSASLKPSPPH